MTSLNDNRPLMYALLSVGLFSVALASNMLPDVSNQFEIIIFPAEFRKMFNFIFLHRKVKSNASQKCINYTFIKLPIERTHLPTSLLKSHLIGEIQLYIFLRCVGLYFFFLKRCFFFILNSKKRFSDSSGFI